MNNQMLDRGIQALRNDTRFHSLYRMGLAGVFKAMKEQEECEIKCDSENWMNNKEEDVYTEEDGEPILTPRQQFAKEAVSKLWVLLVSKENQINGVHNDPHPNND